MESLKAAIELNNLGAEILLVQGCHRQAIATLQDALVAVLTACDSSVSSSSVAMARGMAFGWKNVLDAYPVRHQYSAKHLECDESLSSPSLVNIHVQDKLRAARRTRLKETSDCSSQSSAVTIEAVNRLNLLQEYQEVSNSLLDKAVRDAVDLAIPPKSRTSSSGSVYQAAGQVTHSFCASVVCLQGNITGDNMGLKSSFILYNLAVSYLLVAEDTASSTSRHQLEGGAKKILELALLTICAFIHRHDDNDSIPEEQSAENEGDSYSCRLVHWLVLRELFHIAPDSIDKDEYISVSRSLQQQLKRPSPSLATANAA